MDENKNDLGPSGSQKRLQGDPTSRERVLSFQIVLSGHIRWSDRDIDGFSA